MKMHRLLIVIVLTVVPILIFAGCAKEQVSTAALEPADVSMTTCLPSFVGAESICLTPIFKISNPNNFLVGVDLEYSLEAGGQFVGKSQILRAYIPANGTVEVKDAIVIPFMAWFPEQIIGGKSPEEAMGLVAPIWKGLGGKRPAAVPEAVWDSLEVSKPAMVADGSIIVATETSQKLFLFTSQWQESE